MTAKRAVSAGRYRRCAVGALIGVLSQRLPARTRSDCRIALRLRFADTVRVRRILRASPGRGLGPTCVVEWLDACARH